VIAPAVAAAMINLDVADMDADEDEAEDEEEDEVVEVEMGVVGFAAVAAVLLISTMIICRLLVNFSIKE
jgi:hypothetical protein